MSSTGHAPDIHARASEAGGAERNDDAFVSSNGKPATTYSELEGWLPVSAPGRSARAWSGDRSWEIPWHEVWPAGTEITRDEFERLRRAA